MKGYNGTIFAYGQTGAGKSFTMFGPSNGDDSTRGIIPRACKHIFDCIESDETETEYTLKCSFLEIYKEIIRDLLDPAGVNLKVRETPSRGVWVQGLSEHFVACIEDIMDLLELGEKSRATSSTKMNSVSSRSHSLFILTLTQKNPDGSTREGKLNLADLAGSEKVGKTGASGETLEEAKKINQSLSALGNCINALTKSKKSHIPYRDSKLTHILRESLGGNSKTTLIIACSPHSFNVEETISTLKFGQRAKSIKNSVKINQQRSVKELEQIIETLSNELALLRGYSEKLESTILSKDNNFDIDSLKKRAHSLHKGLNNQEPNKLPSTPTKDFVFAEPMSPLGMSQQQLFSTYNPSALNEVKNKISDMSEKYQKELDQYRSQVDKLREDVKLKVKAYEDLKKETLNYKAELKKLKASYELVNIRESQQEYEKNLKSIENETIIQTLNDQIAHIEEKLSKFKEENEVLSEENISIFNLNASMKGEISSIQKELEASHIELKNKDQILLDLLNESKALYKEKKERDEQVKKYNKEVLNLRESLSENTKNLREKEMQYSIKKKEVDMLQVSREMEINKIQVELEEIRNKNKALDKDVEMKHKDNLSLRDDINTFTSRYDSITLEINSLQQDIDKRKLDNNVDTKYQDEVSRLESLIQEVKNQRIQQEVELSNLLQNLEKNETKFQSHKEDLSKFQKECTTSNNMTTKQLTHANARVLELEEKVSEMKQRISEYKEEIEYFRQQYQLEMERRERSKRRERNISMALRGGQSNTSKKSLMDKLFSRQPFPSREELDIATLKGYLYVQTSSILNRWKYKRIILKGHKLYYFDDDESDHADGYWLIDGCKIKIKQTLEEDNFKYKFMITHPDRKMIYLGASTEAQMFKWVEMIDYISTMSPEDAESIIEGEVE